MRVRTEDRRQAIIDVALSVFREVGFERASMAMIAGRLGGSKGTLYGYFRSKEDLFETTMKAAVEGPGDQILDLLDPEAPDLRSVLCRFAKAYISFVIGTEVLAITRTAIAEGYNSPLGPHLFAQGPGRALAKMTVYFEQVKTLGLIEAKSARSAALHFKGLIEAGFLEDALYGAKLHSYSEIDDAVDAFLRAYGTRSFRKC